MKALRAALAAAVVLGVFAGPSRAGITFTMGDVPQPSGQVRLLFNNDLMGVSFTSTAPDGLSVTFAPTADTAGAPSGKQHRLVSVFGGHFNNLTVGVAGASFGLSATNSSPGNGSAVLTAVANEPGGGTATSTFSYALDPTEKNFVTVSPSGGETLASLTIALADPPSQVQPALSPGPPAVNSGAASPSLESAPEPASLGLCAVGCLTMAAIALRRTRRASRR
jgi:hypothetical protein